MSESYRKFHRDLLEKKEAGEQFGPNQTRALKVMDNATSTGFLSQVAQGLTLNWSDDLVGNMAGDKKEMEWLSGFLKSDKIKNLGYDINLTAGEIGRERESEAVDLYQQQNPGSAIAAQMIGSIPWMMMPGGQAAAGSRLPAAYKIGSQLWKGAAVGGLAGTGRASGGADVNELLGKGGMDAAITAGIGAAMPAAGGLYRGLKGLSRSEGREGQAAAMELVQGELAAGRMTPEEAIVYLKSNPETGMADVLTGLTDVTYQAGGPGQNTLGKFFGSRDKTSLSRLNKHIDDAAGGKGISLFEDLEQQIATKTETGNALYKEAYANPIQVDPEGRLLGILQRDVFKEAWGEARKEASNLGKPFEFNLTKEGIVDAKGALVTEIPTELIDGLKRGADSLISQNLRAGSKIASSQMKARDALLDFADTQNDAFKQARAFWSDAESMRQATELGYSFKTLKSPSAVKAEVEKMSMADKEAFRFGAMKKIQDMVGGIADDATEIGMVGNKAKNILKDNNLLGMLRATFDSQEIYDAFVKGFKQEMKMKITQATATGNSKTAARLAAKENLDRVAGKHQPLDSPLSVLNPLSHFRKGQNILSEEAQAKARSATTNELANILTAPPESLEKLLQQMRPPTSRLDPKQFFPRLPKSISTGYPLSSHPWTTGARGLLGDEDTSVLR